MRPATALEIAEAHLAGPYLEDDEFSRLFSCRKCGATFYVDFELEPTTFCNTCAYDVLDVITTELVGTVERLRIAEQTRDAAQAQSNLDLKMRRAAENVVNDWRQVVVALLASAAPNERDHPAMSKAWANAERFLKRGY